MFASLSRFRRQTAVLTALAMLASVLVAVPAVAADPEPDYQATFDACGAAPDSGFEDVPSNHVNAGDIDCIAYYGVTKGTSATTYSPLMSVSREQMALFLTRLAKLAGISVDDDPDDPGFADIDGLSDESQTAIAQLKALGITTGTTTTTYSPGDNVKRGQMALFIDRLMDEMVPMADGDVGLGTTTQYGYTPSDVDDNDKKADVKSPFTDMRRATNEEYDAITRLYELGVAVGVNATSFSHSSDITRAAMAGFMAAVLDHSNARPNGLSIQVTPATGWGDGDVTVVASMRDDTFQAVEDQAVDIFYSTAEKAISQDGTCNFDADPVLGGGIEGDDAPCVWNINDDTTDVDGNLILDGDVSAGTTKTWYGWIGEDDGDKFDADKVTASTATASRKHAQNADPVKSSTIKPNAFTDVNGQKVDRRATSTVTLTAQLSNREDGNVERAGVKFRVSIVHSTGYTNSRQAEEVTNEKGQVSYTVDAPTSGTRVDTVRFVELLPSGAPAGRNAEWKINWVAEHPVLTSTTLETPTYVLAGNPRVSATVRLWDQYGNPHRSRNGQVVRITIPGVTTGNVDGSPTVNEEDVRPRGNASWSPRRPSATAGDPIAVSYGTIIAYARDAQGYLVTDDEARPLVYLDGDSTAGVQKTRSILDSDGSVRTDLHAVYNDSTPPTEVSVGGNVVFRHRAGTSNVHVVTLASSANTGPRIVTHVMPKNNRFLTTADTTAGNPTLLYSYDDDDIFISGAAASEGNEISMAKFEDLIDANSPAMIANDETLTTITIAVDVVIYNVDGRSVFRVTVPAS